MEKQAELNEQLWWEIVNWQNYWSLSNNHVTFLLKFKTERDEINEQGGKSTRRLEQKSENLSEHA